MATVIVSACVGAAANTLVEQVGAAAKSPSLTALDYQEIAQLVNRYAYGIDTCANNGYDYADVFTPDGLFIDKNSDQGGSEDPPLRHLNAGLRGYFTSSQTMRELESRRASAGAA
jgi:hypothetical protein